MRLRHLVLALLLPCAGLTACQDSGGSSSAGSPEQTHWERLGTFPLRARQGPTVAWTGNEVVVFGGNLTPCPPTADCAVGEPARDGAALDPATRRWRRLADAPAGILDHAPSALVAGHLFVEVGTAVLEYDVAHDAWRTLPRRLPEPRALVADGHRLLAISASDENGTRPDLAYDVRRERWSELPDDPLGSSFDRFVTATPLGLVLTAKKLVPDPGAKPSFVRAALLDRRINRWRSLPQSDQIGGWRWAWLGNRLVDVSLGGADGGEVDNYGRTVRYGGVLDPATGTWSPLPQAPKKLSGGWPVEAAGEHIVAAEGYLYTDAEIWKRVPRPKGAPSAPDSAVWAGDQLIVMGGMRGDRGLGPQELSRTVWGWTPVLGPFQ